MLETGEYFYSQVGDSPRKYNYSEALLPAARERNLSRFRKAISQGISPIVVDRGHGLNRWQELRVLLKYRQFIDEKLFDLWVTKLADATRDVHRVLLEDPSLDEALASRRDCHRNPELRGICPVALACR